MARRREDDTRVHDECGAPWIEHRWIAVTVDKFATKKTVRLCPDDPRIYEADPIPSRPNGVSGAYEYDEEEERWS